MRSRITALIPCLWFALAPAAAFAGFDLKGSDPSSVVLAKSSVLPGVSSVGERPAYLIQGFRAGWYPPDLHSGRMPPDVKNEIRARWAARKR